MTYREVIDLMLIEVQKKAAAYENASLMQSMQAITEWEEAEDAYRGMIARMRKASAKPSDEIPGKYFS